MLLLLLMPLVLAQNPYGPSQLDQYARLLNSGNLGGFGFFQNALAQGSVRGLADLNPSPLLAGLPPLPLTHEEVMRQLTSTTPPPTTRPTAKPTTPSSNPGGVYSVNTMVELPPMPENRIHGTFDDDGVFHPDTEAEKTEEEQMIRNQIQGTKIREFSQAERDTVENHVEENTSKDNDYSNEEFGENSPTRGSVDALAHQLAEHSEKKRKPRQNSSKQWRAPQQNRKYYDLSQNAQVELRPAAQREPRFPPFIFRPRPPPAQRDAEYNNLLAEIEEYDDFLEQQRVYRSQYPSANLQNPYRDLPPGQLPAAGSYSAQGSSRTYDIPAPRRISQGLSSSWTPQQQQWSPSVQQPTAVTEYPMSATENPLLNIFKIFSSSHAHALAAPQLSLDATTPAPTTTNAPLPRLNPYHLGMLPAPIQGVPLVNIQQQPLLTVIKAQQHMVPYLTASPVLQSFPQLGSPLVLMPLFTTGK